MIRVPVVVLVASFLMPDPLIQPGQASVEDSLAACVDEPERGIDSMPGRLKCGGTTIEYDKYLMAGDQCKDRPAVSITSPPPALEVKLCSNRWVSDDILFATIPQRDINYWVRSPKPQDVLLLIAVAKRDASRGTTK